MSDFLDMVDEIRDGVATEKVADYMDRVLGLKDTEDIYAIPWVNDATILCATNEIAAQKPP